MEHHRKSYVMYQIVSFSMTFSYPNPGFKVNISKMVCLRDNFFYRTLIGNYNQYVEWYQFR